MSDGVEWLDDETARVANVEFTCRNTNRFPSSPSHFLLAKRPDLVRRYAALLRSHAPQTLIELGVLQGGSAAFASLVARPAQFLAFERSTERVEALDAMLEEHGLAPATTIHYGVDQADVEGMRALLDEAALSSGRTIDLVVDDASHLNDQTRASFELIFPLLRPGALYIVEDWAWAHVGLGFKLPDVLPLSAFVFEAVFAAAGRPEMIDEVAMDRDWAVIRRGHADLPTDGSFQISDLYNWRASAVVPSAESTSARAWT